MSKPEPIVYDETKLPPELCTMIREYMPVCNYHLCCEARILSHVLNGKDVCGTCFKLHQQRLQKQKQRFTKPKRRGFVYGLMNGISIGGAIASIMIATSIILKK